MAKMSADACSISLPELLASIEAPVLRDAKLVAELSGGPVSRSLQLKTSMGDAVLRLDMPLAAELGLDRRAELLVLKSVASVGIGPEVLWADPGRGLLVTRLLAGRTWEAVDMVNRENLIRLGALFSRVHSMPIVCESKDLRTSIASYAEVINTDTARSLRASANKLLNELSDNNKNMVFCHRDVHCGNILDDGALRLIDWEYGGSGDPCFDLAVVAEQQQLNEWQLGCLLEGYAGLPYSVEINRLKKFRSLYKHIAQLWYLAAMRETNSDDLNPAGVDGNV
jgi:aminoglycoside phosphotransferase (APT) family kinase protein